MFPKVLDNTIVSSFTNCPLACKYAHFDKKQKGTKSIHLHAGGAFAKGLEVARMAYFGNHLSQEEAEAYGLQALITEYGDFDPQSTAKSLDRMCGAFEFYCAQWPFAEDFAQPLMIGDKPAVEWSFALPLPINNPDTGEPILFTGRCDTLDTVAGGLYVHDDKTTSSLGESWPRQWEMRGQFVGYAWALREVGMTPRGTLVRGVSILKTKYDKAEVLISQPDWKIDEWHTSFLSRVQRMVDTYTKGYFYPVFDEACNHYGGCEFKQVCLSKNHHEELDNFYSTRDWNPLERK